MTIPSHQNFDQLAFIEGLNNNFSQTGVLGRNVLVLVTTFYEMAEGFVQWVEHKDDIELSAALAPKSHIQNGLYGLDKSYTFTYKHTQGLNSGSFKREVLKQIKKKDFDSIIILKSYMKDDAFRAVAEFGSELGGDKAKVFLLRPDGSFELYSRPKTSSKKRPTTKGSYKNVVLVSTAKDHVSINAMPMNLIPLAQILSMRGHRVTVIEQALRPNIQDELQRLNPDVIGVTATTLSFKYACEVLLAARERSNARLVIGGRHASIFPYHALQFADVVVVGEGENAIVEAVESDNPRALINGEPLMDISFLPPIPFHLFEDMQVYMDTRDRIPWCQVRFAPPGSKVGQLMTGRGCPFSCIYCHNSYQKLPLRFYSLASLEQEIDYLNRVWGSDHFFFFDDDFLADKKRFKEVINLFKNQFGFMRWTAQTHSKTIDDELAAMAAEAGCVQIMFGFESGSQKTLNFLKNKKFTLEDNRRALAVCRRNGIKSISSFIIGAPGETEADMRETEKFIMEEDLDDAALYILTPFPGSLIWEKHFNKQDKWSPGLDFWSNFDMGAEAIGLCDTMPHERLREIFFEILENMASRFSNVRVSPYTS